MVYDREKIINEYRMKLEGAIFRQERKNKNQSLLKELKEELEKFEKNTEEFADNVIANIERKKAAQLLGVDHG